MEIKETARLMASDMLKQCALMLKESGIEEAEKEAEIILRYGIGMDRVRLYRDDPLLKEHEIKRLMHILKMRKGRRKPLQYILGYAEFCGLEIKVGPGVLIPRPETEVLVSEVLKKLENRKSASILDLCTGSGCIGIALARRLPEAEVYGVDISEDALRYAEENKMRHGLRNLTFLRGSLFEPVSDMKFDVIVSNPPYIRKDVIDTLQPEVRDWEPMLALEAGDGGLEFFKRILNSAPAYLKPGGLIAFEAGEGQAGEIIKAAHEQGFESVSVIKDYAGIERVIISEAERGL